MPSKLNFKQAQDILKKMHFRLSCHGRRNNNKFKNLSWTTVQGQNFYEGFEKESLEEIIEFAKKRLPVWDEAIQFEAFDVIEMSRSSVDKKRIIAVVEETPDVNRSGFYKLYSHAFTGNPSRIEYITNYELTFVREVKLKQRGGKQVIEEENETIQS